MSRNTRKVAVGTMIAGLIGYVTGILTAPKSGKETRADIGLAANKAKTEAERNLKRLHSELNGLIDQGKQTTENLKSKAQGELSAGLDKAKEAREKVRGLLSALHDGDAEDKDLQKAIKEADQAIAHLKKYLTKDADSQEKK